MAIWNNNTCNSHREFYKQYGTTPLNAQGVNNLSITDQCFLNFAPTIVNSIFQFIGQNVDFDGSSSSSSSSGEAEVIQEEIDKILNNYRDKGYGVSTIDDLEALLEVNEGENLVGLEKDIQDLKTYMKQLKKAEGRDAIDELVNEATGNITDLIDKYNINPNDKLKEKLRDALQEYVSNTENPSPTIVKYAAIKFGIEK